MSNLIEHAKREFFRLGYKKPEDDEEGPNRWIQENVLELLKVFSDQGHSGMSAPFCISYFEKLVKFEPLSPLQGTDDEWIEVANNLWQNTRCSHVFKDDKKAYDIEGKIFREPDGVCYTSAESRVDVTFPYTPKSEYINVSKANDE